jgi:hypothetical protein
MACLFRFPQFRRVFKTKTKVSRSGGEEHPSRGRTGCEVTIFMQNISKFRNDCADNDWGSFTRTRRRKGVLGGARAL